MSQSIQLAKYIGAAALISLTASCGGGGSGSGGATAFSVIPTTSTFTAGKGNTTCAVDPRYSYGSATIVTIIGGSPPYRIVNSSPDNLAISATTVTGKNPTFTVWTIGGCGSSMPVLVIDNMSRSIAYTTTVTAGEEDTATTPATTTTTP